MSSATLPAPDGAGRVLPHGRGDAPEGTATRHEALRHNGVGGGVRVPVGLLGRERNEVALRSVSSSRHRGRCDDDIPLGSRCRDLRRSPKSGIGPAREGHPRRRWRRIYCEALPCPCLKPGDPQGGGGTSRPRPRARPRPEPKPSSRATTLTARITAVVDGDTVKVRRRFGWDGARFVVRVEQVLDDAPTDFYR